MTLSRNFICTRVIHCKISVRQHRLSCDPFSVNLATISTVEVKHCYLFYLYQYNRTEHSLKAFERLRQTSGTCSSATIKLGVKLHLFLVNINSEP